MPDVITFLIYWMRQAWMKDLIWAWKDIGLIGTYIAVGVSAKYLWRERNARWLIFTQIASLAFNVAWDLHLSPLLDWKGGDAIALLMMILTFGGIICILRWPLLLLYVVTGFIWFAEYQLAETGFESDRRAANALYLIRCWAQIVCYAWTALAIYLWREEKRMSDCEKKPKEPKKPKPKPVPLGGPKTAEPPPDQDPH